MAAADATTKAPRTQQRRRGPPASSAKNAPALAAATAMAHRRAPRPAAPSPAAGLRSGPAAAVAARLSTRLDPMPPVRRSHRYVGGESPAGDDCNDSAGEHDAEQPGQFAGLLAGADEPAPEVGRQVARGV